MEKKKKKMRRRSLRKQHRRLVSLEKGEGTVENISPKGRRKSKKDNFESHIQKTVELYRNNKLN